LLRLGYKIGESGLPEIANRRRLGMKKLTLLVAMLAMVLLVAAPAMAAQEKMDEKMKMEEKDKDKDKMKDKKEDDKGKKKDEMPKTGGAPINAALLGLGAATLLVGGGLMVRKVTR
jgi:LPXTG-motif cell wall-anchored protein